MRLETLSFGSFRFILTFAFALVPGLTTDAFAFDESDIYCTKEVKSCDSLRGNDYYRTTLTSGLANLYCSLPYLPGCIEADIAQVVILPVEPSACPDMPSCEELKGSDNFQNAIQTYVLSDLGLNCQDSLRYVVKCIQQALTNQNQAHSQLEKHFFELYSQNEALSRKLLRAKRALKRLRN
jgi:hypothetical protein